MFYPYPQIPGYDIDKKIGEGGMGVVYQGFQRKTARRVAIKILDPQLLKDRSLAERFLNEAETVAHFSHPHIVTIYDLGSSGSTYYLVMEFLGRSLKERIEKARSRSKGLPPAQALTITGQIAGCLHYAHWQGFVHRDIKPDNILFRDRNTAVLVDFGIAKALGSESRITKTGTSIGTPHYMSPEQIKGQAVDGRSDLYSLGVVLYEMLVGDVPYSATDTIAIAIQHVQQAVPRLPGSRQKYQPLLDKMLAKDPKERFQTGKGVLDQVRRLAAEADRGQLDVDEYLPLPETQPDADPVVEETVEEKKKSRWNKAGPAAALGTFLIVLVMMLVSVLLKERAVSMSPRSVAEDSQVEANGETLQQGNPVSLEDQFSQIMRRARDHFDQGRYKEAAALLDRAKSLKKSYELGILEEKIRQKLAEKGKKKDAGNR